MTDVWVQRTSVEFAQVIRSELPTGDAWQTDPDDGLQRWIDGCAQIWGDVSVRAALAADPGERSTPNL